MHLLFDITEDSFGHAVWTGSARWMQMKRASVPSLALVLEPLETN